MPTISQIQIGDTTYDIKDASTRNSVTNYFKLVTGKTPEFTISANTDYDLKYYTFRRRYQKNDPETDNWKLIALLAFAYDARTETWHENNLQGDQILTYMPKSWGIYNTRTFEIVWRNWYNQSLFVHLDYRTLWVNIGKNSLWNLDLTNSEKASIFSSRESKQGGVNYTISTLIDPVDGDKNNHPDEATAITGYNIGENITSPTDWILINPDNNG